MKGRLLIIIFISICFIAGSCNVSSVQGSRYNFSLLDSVIQGWVSKEYYPGASICVVKNDSVIFQKNYGSYTPDTKVYVASAGKWVAAAVIGAVVDRTDLDWNDNVKKWIPEFKNDVKGMITFTLAQEVLKDGGYLIVDEIENHFNKEIVSTLIRFFMDGKINKNGGMLIFSTHYPELLDEYDRNDSIFITRNRDGITAENLSNILKRNDIKKSDAYQSGFLEGTTPTYEAYMQLKKSITASLK